MAPHTTVDVCAGLEIQECRAGTRAPTEVPRADEDEVLGEFRQALREAEEAALKEMHERVEAAKARSEAALQATLAAVEAQLRQAQREEDEAEAREAARAMQAKVDAAKEAARAAMEAALTARQAKEEAEAEAAAKAMEAASRVPVPLDDNSDDEGGAMPTDIEDAYAFKAPAAAGATSLEAVARQALVAAQARRMTRGGAQPGKHTDMEVRDAIQRNLRASMDRQGLRPRAPPAPAPQATAVEAAAQDAVAAAQERKRQQDQVLRDEALDHLRAAMARQGIGARAPAAPKATSEVREHISQVMSGIEGKKEELAAALRARAAEALHGAAARKQAGAGGAAHGGSLAGGPADTPAAEAPQEWHLAPGTWEVPPTTSPRVARARDDLLAAVRKVAAPAERSPRAVRAGEDLMAAIRGAVGGRRFEFTAPEVPGAGKGEGEEEGVSPRKWGGC